MRLPPISAWQEANGDHTNGGGGGGGGGINNFSSHLTGDVGRGASPSNESVGSDLGMVLIERPTSA